MPKSSLIPCGLLLLILLNSCKDINKEVREEKNNDGTEKFVCTKNNFSDFIVMSSSLDKFNRPSTVTYTFKGTLKNNTENIYEKAAIRGELILVLENGNELTCNDINYTKNLLGDGIASENRSNWKPNEEWNIDELSSCSFSVEYFDYPVKEIFTQYYINLTDQINNVETDILISQKDVTDKWKIARQKVKNNNYDCSDDVWEIKKFLKLK